MKAFNYIIPILFIALFVFGIPLGYKFVLGGQDKEKGSGIISFIETTEEKWMVWSIEMLKYLPTISS